MKKNQKTNKSETPNPYRASANMMDVSPSVKRGKISPEANISRQTYHGRKPVNVYPQGFVFGQGEADPKALSLSGLKIARALQALGPVKGCVLELGCGGGQYLRALQRYRPDLELFAVDLDAQAVAAVNTIPQVTCMPADVSALPFEDHQFQAVMGFDILEHVDDPGKVLREAVRVLQPGGLLHLYVPCEGNPGTVYVKKGHACKAEFGGHQQQYTTDGLAALIEKNGFDRVEIRYADYWLTQQFDYAFFSRLAKSAHPESLWAAQALRQGGGLQGWVLRQIRRALSVLAWLEGTLRTGPQGAMGVHVTARKR
ncbi:class I SAM-dependent methyltransferase [bacterium]|nr:class I SAM-dependent methyltransferase [bacterium]